MKITNLYALATYVITLSLRMRKSEDVHIVVIIFNKDIHKKNYTFLRLFLVKAVGYTYIVFRFYLLKCNEHAAMRRHV